MLFHSDDEISASRPFYNPDTTSILAPKGQGCPRCGGMVFAAEQQLAKGTVSTYLFTRLPANPRVYNFDLSVDDVSHETAIAGR